MNYYEILNLDSSATDEEIKKAFRGLSLKHHPDRTGGDDEQFKLISEAYSLLSDPEKRKIYDMSIEVSPRISFDQAFNKIFYPKNPKLSADIHLDIELTIKDLFKGSQVRKAFIRKIECSACNGSGLKTTICAACSGVGRMSLGKDSPISSTCHYCSGAGKVSEPLKACTSCSSIGYASEEAKHAFNIPSGIGNLGSKTTINVPNLGNKVRGVRGSVILNITILPDEHFSQNGNILLYKQDVNITDLFLGSKKEIILPDDNIVTIKIPPLSKPSTNLRLKSKGLPKARSRGDLLVQLNLIYPSALTEKQKELLKLLKGEGL